MAVLLDYTFDGDDTRGWGFWAAESGYGGATGTVVAGRGRLTVPSGVSSYGAGITEWIGPYVLDGTWETTLILPNTTYELGSAFYFRDGGGGRHKRSVYGITLSQSGGGFNIQRWDDTVPAGSTLPFGTRTTLGTISKSGIVGKSWRIKAVTVGARLKVRIWEVGTTEPSTWDYNAVTDGHVPTGTHMRAEIVSGNAITPSTLFTEWDNAKMSDAVMAAPGAWAAVKVTGSASANASWNLVAGANEYHIEVQRWDGTTWVAQATVIAGSSPFTLNNANAGIVLGTRYRARVTAKP